MAGAAAPHESLVDWSLKAASLGLVMGSSQGLQAVAFSNWRGLIQLKLRRRLSRQQMLLRGHAAAFLSHDNSALLSTRVQAWRRLVAQEHAERCVVDARAQQEAVNAKVAAMARPVGVHGSGPELCCSLM